MALANVWGGCEVMRSTCRTDASCGSGGIPLATRYRCVRGELQSTDEWPSEGTSMLKYSL
jgi:hypothetical protein